jgi:transposase
MSTSATIFGQIMHGLQPVEFARCVEAHPPPRSSRSFTAYDHFLSQCFGQLTYRESARDIVSCLKARMPLLYHMGFRGRLTRTNFAYANTYRDWRVFAAVAEVLCQRAQRLYRQDPPDPDLPQVVLALDASMIHLSLQLFPWAYWGRSRAGALKLHTLLALQGSLPIWAAMTEATFPEVKMLSQVPVQPGAYYVMDRAYLDFTRLIRLHEGGAKFVVRNKRHVRFTVQTSRPVDKATGLRCDQIVRLKSTWSKTVWPHRLRRIHFREPSEGRMLIFLTNDLELPALTICQLYKRRWEVELFFKWIKQHLRIRRFFGHSKNAIYCQVWIAICAYLLVAIARKQCQTSRSLYEVLQIVSVNIFEQTPLAELLATAPTPQAPSAMQMSLI